MNVKPSVLKRLLTVLLAAAQAAAARADDDAFELFEEEAKVVSASFLPKSLARAPATVRVVTSEEIKASGAQTIWDALRGVPGVEVAQTAAFQGEVGIRGLNGPLNNRVLVLLDGRTVMNANFDWIIWESIPVTMEEIARIEVVQGPASALYGANAIGGVINIITKSPAQMKGGAVGFSAGEAGFRSGFALYGTRKGRLDYKVAAGSRYGNGFVNEGIQASQTSKLHALAGWDFSPEARLRLSGGLTKLNTRTTTGSIGTAFVDGYTGFLRTDYRYRETNLTAFWNQERSTGREVPAFGDPTIDYDTWDVNLRRAWRLPLDNRLVLGGNYRRNSVRSTLLDVGGSDRDLWSLFLENEWSPREDWLFIAGGRLDRHPLTPVTFSPRGSAIYEPSDAHVFRLSAGTAFRNPTAIESDMHITQIVSNSPGGALPNPPFTGIHVLSRGSRVLSPEKIFQAELSHGGKFGPVRTALTGFYYELRNLIRRSDAVLISAVPPTAGFTATFQNHGGTRALGFEGEAEAAVRPGLSLFGNYSYQSLRDDDPRGQTNARAAPRHKASAGARVRSVGLTAGLWAHWVDKTFWNRNPIGSPISYGKVPDYLLLNGRVGYEFSGRWEGWEASAAVFNLAARRHFEMLPASGALPGMNSEVVRGRWTGAVSYRFR